MEKNLDLTNKYLSSLSTSSDYGGGSNIHALVGEDIPESGPVPVSTPLVVDPSMRPSPFVPHPPSKPPPPSSSVSSESSDEETSFPGFRAHDDQEHEPIRTINVGDSGSLDTHDQAVSSQSSYFSIKSSTLSVSLPLDSSQWTEILPIHPLWGRSSPDDLIRVVEGDSRRLCHYEVVERLRECDRQAVIAGLPLAPIPNVDGLKAPLGIKDPITSISQITALSPAELNTWLEHYGLPLPQGDGGQSNTRSLLATHLGLGSVLSA